MQDVSGWKLRLDAETIAAYTSSGQWTNTTVWQAAERYARQSADRVVLVEGAVQMTVRQVVDAARQLAAGLHAIGLRAGDVISYQLPNWWETVVINLAACASGLIVNPIVPIYRDGEVRHVLRDARTRAFFVPESFRGFDHLGMATRLRAELPDLSHVVVVRGSAPRTSANTSFDAILAAGRSDDRPMRIPDPNAVKLVLYTSGTTGRPKGVLHTHNTLMSEINAVIDYWRVGEDDVVIMPSPVTHVTGYLYALELPFVARASTVLMERWDAGLAAALIHRHRATLTVGATPFLAELAQQAGPWEGLPSLRVFASGGAPVPPEIVSRARRALVNCAVFRVYGSSEAPTVSLGIAAGDDPELGATTDGRIVNNQVRICDPATGAHLPAGAEGEVVVRGPEVMVGYTTWVDTEEAFDSQGYFRTGDLAFLSHGDFLTISGRKKDLIIRGGENISAKEIEDLLHAHTSVGEAAVVSMPHERLGESVCAYIVPNGDAVVDLALVTRILDAAGLARQKYPERVEVVSELPRTASGKVQKNLLRERIRAVLAAEKPARDAG